MKMRKVLLALGVAALLSGCGTIGNAVITDDELARKAAFALDTTADQVTISDREPEAVGVTLNFVATTKGRRHQCYITTVMGAANSSAICSGANSANTSSDKNCNDLLKAAGQCR